MQLNEKNNILLSSRQAKRIDSLIQKRFLLSTLVLMENAGRAVAEQLLPNLNSKSKIAFFCGKGNNGGDGFVACRHLLSNGFRSDVYLAADSKDVKKEARMNLDILLKLKQKIISVKKNNLLELKKKIYHYDYIVDALFGVGLVNNVEGVSRGVIEAINESGAFCLAIDIPSGLNATTGNIMGASIKADETVTFMAKKIGMGYGKGKLLCGKITIKDIGFPYRTFCR
jgi:hydroxyethylthiazole kinase-like uncharacterized protein yjeF